MASCAETSDSLCQKDSNVSFYIDPSYEPKKLISGKPKLDFSELNLQNERKVSVLYTGGTIGMRINSDGVYSPSSNLMKALQSMTLFHDQEYVSKNMNISNVSQQPLCLPARSGGNRILYSVYEYQPLLDSSNMTMDDWIRIALDIETQYDLYDGFVILHGTDTMAYTASALSFVLENLGKPVILTGSQIPIFELRSDGRDNFLDALILAGDYCIPEVMLFFNNKLFRGNRSMKQDASSFNAFDSPSLAPLAQMEVDIKVNWESVFYSKTLEKFHVHDKLCSNVGILRLFPSITAQTVESFLEPPMQGVVLQTYGAGNAPDVRQDLMNAFKKATNRDVIIVNITQCYRGVVSTSYATGKVLLDAGVIPGSDMTTEACLTKLAYVLGKEDWDIKMKRKMMSRNIRGEMKVTLTTDISLGDLELIQTLAQAMSLSSTEEIHLLKGALYPALICAASKAADVLALQKLLETGGSVNMTDHDGRTALHVAASQGNFNTVQYLLRNGASVHIKDSRGCTPLLDAIHKNHYDIIRLLIQTGAHAPISNLKLASELCQLAADNDMDSLKAWKLANINFNVSDYDARSPLHVAVCNNNKEAALYLLDNGANMSCVDNFGNTPLSDALRLNLTELYESLKNWSKSESSK